MSSFLGLRSSIAGVPDLERAKTWYARLLGVQPYFDQPFYVDFNVGGFELGLHPEDDELRSGRGGFVNYWGVARMAEAWPQVLELGARAVKPPADVGEGIQVAVVEDPFGNLVGLIENPHFPNKA